MPSGVGLCAVSQWDVVSPGVWAAVGMPVAVCCPVLALPAICWLPWGSGRPGFGWGPVGIEDRGPQGGSTEQPTGAAVLQRVSLSPETSVPHSSAAAGRCYIDLLCVLMSGRKFGARGLYTGLKVLPLTGIASQVAVICVSLAFGHERWHEAPVQSGGL